MPSVKAKLDEIKAYVPDQRHPRRVADQDGQARRGDRRLDGGQRAGRHRHPVLDGDGRVLRRRALHADEHDEQRPDAVAPARPTSPGVVGMYAMALASGKPSALVDWNNNYGDDPDKGVVFHCSNLPKDIFVE